MMMGKKNEILDLSFDFALEIIKLVKHFSYACCIKFKKYSYIR